MATTIKQLATLSTLLVLSAVFWFLFVVLHALGLDDALSYFASFLICVLLAPTTWRFAVKEAQLMNGDSDADRKD
mgnify:CR=1 FL=1